VSEADVDAVVFRDRSDAGRPLARRLAGLASDDVVVLGLPRGGVPVAAEVARLLRAPLDVVLAPMTLLAEKTAIVVDDGIATGATARAACEVVRLLDERRGAAP
jgi:predicted phosphoribosyltransferase